MKNPPRFQDSANPTFHCKLDKALYGAQTSATGLVLSS
jgi:hypothetical protein